MDVAEFKGCEISLEYSVKAFEILKNYDGEKILTFLIGCGFCNEESRDLRGLKSIIFVRGLQHQKIGSKGCENALGNEIRNVKKA